MCSSHIIPMLKDLRDFMMFIHFILCVCICICGFLMCMANNPIESAIFLILSFVSAAGILFIFHVDFLGLLLIIIYVGAIAVLFLFVIMMLNIKNERKDELNMNTKVFLSIVSLTIISSYFFLSINVFNSEELFLSRQLNLL